MSQDAEKFSLQFENQVILLMKIITWHTFQNPHMKFPDISLTFAPFQNFPDIFFKFPDNSLTLKNIFPDFSLTRDNPVDIFSLDERGECDIAFYAIGFFDY